MKTLNYQGVYDDYMDREVIPLCNAMNSLPGIETFESCCGHGDHPARIFFTVENTKTGLFFLARCTDNRYWEHGHQWSIIVSVADCYENSNLPVYYLLESTIKGNSVYEQMESLVENLNEHLNHTAFLDLYELDTQDFIFEC